LSANLNPQDSKCECRESHISGHDQSSNQDIQLAKQLLSLTPSSQFLSNIANEHGVDIIFGGHDHLYFVGRGVDEWDNYNLSDHVLGAEEDEGDALVIKSGTDFRDISEVCLKLKDTPEGSIRRKLINRVTGKSVPYRGLELL
jgi:5'-nucleotidase